MIRDIDRVLISEERIAQRVGQLAGDIVADLQRHAPDALGNEGRLVLVPVLTGSIVFVADLIRRLPMKLSLEMVAVSSYPGATTQSKGASLRGALPGNLGGRHVLVVDDIFDSGQTLDVLSRLIREQGPASLRLCTLLRKPGKSVVGITPEFVGFDIPDEFVVGYGLDYDGFYRNYPQIATLRPEAREGPSAGG